jgi:hypothetical protein
MVLSYTPSLLHYQVPVHAQFRECSSMHLVADRVSRGHAWLFQAEPLRLQGR